MSFSLMTVYLREVAGKGYICAGETLCNLGPNRPVRLFLGEYQGSSIVAGSVRAFSLEQEDL
jgi:hypothetical protein